MIIDSVNPGFNVELIKNHNYHGGCDVLKMMLYFMHEFSKLECDVILTAQYFCFETNQFFGLAVTRSSLEREI